MRNSFLIGTITNYGNSIPRLSTEFRPEDYFGAVMVRWGINRNNYRVQPGIYAIGNPDESSDVFVTANYKLTFDQVRKNLSGLNCWVLVLDTKGVNVWCAAGKGIFGTKELVNKINEVSLGRIVNHKRIILPQLGATGVAAHKVKEETGFNVHYGPVRATDIKRFVSSGYRADKGMRSVTFRFADRVKLIPNDFIYGKFYLLSLMAVVLIISGITSTGFSYSGFTEGSGRSMLNVFFGYITGVVITPMLLPYIPGKRFSMKGFYSGSLMCLILFAFHVTGKSVFEITSWFLVITSVSSFLAMNFTGSSTYTSLSGVKKEMSLALPLQIVFALTGIALQIIGKLI